jgi:hypothetical protein
MQKFDLTGITFLTFVRIDNSERSENIQAMVSYYRNTCKNYSHIFIEDSDVSTLPDIIDFESNDTYVFCKSDTEWKKGEGYNKGIKLAKTNIINFIDVDAIIHPLQLIEGKLSLEKDNNSGIIYPYNGLFLCTDKNLKNKFCEKQDINLFSLPAPLKEFKAVTKNNQMQCYSLINGEYNGITIGHVNSIGGCVMGRRDNIIKCNGYNPYFKGWGFEDDEIPCRINKLGYTVSRISGVNKPLWHLHHFNEEGSKKEDQPFYQHNKNLYEKIKSLSKSEVENYIKGWKL